jgi:hypothetical protein
MLQGTPPGTLAPRAWYQAYVEFDKDKKAVGRLDGVTFQTSRWRNPAEMLAGLGFTAATQPGTASGDIEIKSLPAFDPAVVTDQDAAFEAALDKLGLDGWPIAGEPRTSIIWLRKDDTAGPAWLCAGVLIESPEPIHRPDRAEVAGLRIGMGASHLEFDIHRRDRAGTRLLYLTTRPFKPQPFGLGGGPATLQPRLLLAIKDLAGQAPLLTGGLKLALTPSFAAEA